VSRQPGPDRDEELADADDRRIGAAFRYSMLVLAGMAAVGALVWYWLPRPEAPPARKEAAVVAPKARAAAPVAPPRMRFTDITRASGIDFVHHNGAYGEKLLPETMGGGVAVLDIDGDGHADLLFVDSGDWPWHAKGAARSSLRLYRNDGTGHFTDVTAGSGLEGSFYGMGVAIGDFDNDGRDDIVVTGIGTLRLYRNLGGPASRLRPTIGTPAPPSSTWTATGMTTSSCAATCAGRATSIGAWITASPAWAAPTARRPIFRARSRRSIAIAATAPSRTSRSAPASR
jgi:hypothetical protein